jgi:hypothetical protein
MDFVVKPEIQIQIQIRKKVTCFLEEAKLDIGFFAALRRKSEMAKSRPASEKSSTSSKSATSVRLST